MHVIDAADGDPAEQWAVDDELAAYGAGLDELPQIVVLNKIDIAPDPQLDVQDERVVAVFPLSCATGEGVERFKRSLFSLVPEPDDEPVDGRGGAGLPRLPAEAAPRSLQAAAHRPRVPSRRATTGRGRARGALRAAGAREGDEVAIGDEEFECR